MPNDSYVYIIFDYNGVPRYVGKGRGQRWLKHTKSHNAKVRRLFANSNPPIVKVREQISDFDAIVTEIALIKAIGRYDQGTGTLYNRTDGGEGLAGYIQSEETRQKHGAHSKVWFSIDANKVRVSELAKVRWEDPAKRKNISDAIRAYHANMSGEDKLKRKLKISQATRQAMIGDASEKIRASRVGKSLTQKQQAVLDKMAKINAASEHTMTPKRQKALDATHAGNVGRHHSEETRAKMSASDLRRSVLKRQESLSHEWISGN